MTLWSDPDADPLSDLKSWLELTPVPDALVHIVACPPKVWELVKGRADEWSAELTDYFGRPVRLAEWKPDA